ncbi:MAG: hypothetical protein E7658_00455 [Ruminococcaceae bacterium]|nr:hypothetical protein [Oscillospiraceae bacterium]
MECRRTCFFMKNGERQEGGNLRHTQAVCAMYKRLKKRFPHVIFENCASGGARTDLGLLPAFHHTWVSDWQKAPRSLAITAGMTTVLPPERVTRLVNGMGGADYASLQFQMRNAMLCNINISSGTNRKQNAFLKHSLAVYRDFIRPFQPTAKMYHHNADGASARRDGFCAMELTAADRTRAAMAVFCLPGHDTSPITVYPKGPDAGRTYRITFDNSGTSAIVSGRSCWLRASLCA